MYQAADRVTEGLSDEDLELLYWDWKFWARPKQLAPIGDWATWLILAGRGFGKTRTGVQWCHERALDFPGRWIALVAKTPADARDFIIDGPGGFKKNIPKWECPVFEVSKRRLTWPNGSWATIYSDEDPDQLRGYSGDTAWLDEFAKFRNPQDCWDNLQFGMREASNDRPRRLITTTPRPIAILKTLIASRYTVFVKGTSHENKVNLDPTWYQETVLDYENTRLGSQEVYANILEDHPGALWRRQTIEDSRLPGRDARVQTYEQWVESWRNRLVRIVVSLDPAGVSTEGAAEHGIVVAGVDDGGHGVVLEDLSKRTTPDGAARIVISAYDRWLADRTIGEVNNGAEWIGTTIKQTARAMYLEGLRDHDEVAYKAVHASRGKQTRAEPISAMYEQGRVHHVGLLPDLEDQQCTWDPLSGQRSPDHMDANVWALTDLMVGSKKKAGVLF